MKHQIYPLELPISDPQFDILNLVVESEVLRKNALQDPSRRHHFILRPKSAQTRYIVFHLAGYFGNGSHNFHSKTLEENLAQQILRATKQDKISPMTHIFVDAMTALGGSQFINSVCGRYADHLQKELAPLMLQIFDKKIMCLLGSSSGGYGALQNISFADSAFDVAMAIAPDSHFASSLLPEIYKLSPYLQSYPTVKSVLKALSKGELQKKKNFFDLMNVLAMTACYGDSLQFEFPIDLKTGEIHKKVWQRWQSQDPVYFLEQRKKHLRDKKIYLEVGEYDDFCLYFGARQIKKILKKNKISYHYDEFPGTHFGLNEKKIKALQWLSKN